MCEGCVKMIIDKMPPMIRLNCRMTKRWEISLGDILPLAPAASLHFQVDHPIFGVYRPKKDYHSDIERERFIAEFRVQYLRGYIWARVNTVLPPHPLPEKTALQEPGH